MLQKVTKFVGVFLFLVAFVIGLLILTTIFQVLFQPESVAGVKVVSDFLSAQMPLLTSDIKGRASSINVDPSARLIVVYFVSAFVVFTLSSLMHSLIRGGLSLVKYSDEQSSDI